MFALVRVAELRMTITNRERAGKALALHGAGLANPAVEFLQRSI